MAKENEKEYFSNAEIKLLITTRIKYEKDFTAGKKSKSVLWGKIISEIKDVVPDFRFDRTQIHRKFLNIMITYKRIKSRNKKTGRDATTWGHSVRLDEVYGSKHSIQPSIENLISSVLPAANVITNMEQESHSLPSTKTQTAENNLFSEVVVDEVDESFTEPHHITPYKRRRTTKENETLEFLRQEANREDLRHEEIMELERQKLVIEQERIQEMRDLKTVLQQMLENRSAN